MDYGIQNSHHHQLYGAPQTLAQPQPQPPPAAAAHLYSTYYSTANPNPYPNPQAAADPPSSSLVFADGGVAQAAEHYAGTGFDFQALSYGAYQPLQHAALYSNAQALAAASFQQAKRKLKIHSNILDLEEKKQKIIEGGASADAIRVCTICNVVCNSPKVFASHLAGEKHTLKALGNSYRSMVPKVMAQIKQMSYAKKSAPKAVNNRYGIGYIAAPKVVQTFTCEVCKIECNSQETLNTHKMGKRHKVNLQKLQVKITPKPSAASAEKNISTGQDQTTNARAVKKASSAKEDLQTKKDKVVKGGAAEEDIIVCVLCDIVCNSKAVYSSHIAGKKHLSMIKKQEQTQV